MPFRRCMLLMMFIAVPALGGDATVDKLSFLTGAWQGEMFGGTFTARYTAPGGDILLSYSELTRDGKLGSYEFEKFSMIDGKLTFSAYAGGKPMTPLTMTELSDKRVVFENPDKDFPTRIAYEVRENRLVVTLSDPHGDSDKEMIFDLERME